MADKDKYVSIKDLKAKLRYWCKSRGASKQAQESLIEIIKHIPYTVRADISETLDSTRWIPCRERMPEEGVNVNITWVNKTISDDKFVGTALRLNGVWYWYPLSSRFLVEIDDECGVEVLAWMPLPDAYEPPEEVDENG